MCLAFTCLILGTRSLDAQGLPKLPKYMFADVDRHNMSHWVDSVYRSLDIEAQVAQLIMPIVYPSADAQRLQNETERIKRHQWGGILYQKGMMPEQLEMNQRLQSVSRVPMLIALDGEWGLYMRLKDAPRYPRNMGLGLRGDSQLLYNYGREVARQCRLMGIHVNFAPDVDVNINPRNPVIGTRSFGEDPSRVAESSIAYASGLEDGDVLSVAKHFPGHGDTSEDSHHTLPTVSASKKRMKEVELFPFVKYIKHGLGGVMTAHLNIPVYDSSSLPSSLSQRITTQLLKDELGFSGLVFTDGLEMKGVTEGGVKEIGVLALLAGNDILLGPTSPEAMHAQIVRAVREGRIARELIKEKVLKVLCYKWRLIIASKHQSTSASRIKEEVWTKEARTLQRNLWHTSLYTVRSDGEVLAELKKRTYKRIAVIQVGKNPAPLSNRPRSTGREGSRIDYYTWDEYTAKPQLSRGYALQLIQVFTPSVATQAKIESLSSSTPTIVAYMTSPYRVPDGGKKLKAPKLVLIAFEAAREAQQAVLDLLTANQIMTSKESESAEEDTHDPTANTGRLHTERQASPPLDALQSMRSTIRSSSGASTADRLATLDALAMQGIREGAYPGCQIYIAHRGQVVYNKAFGTLTGGVGATPLTKEHIYDVASITKALATTPVVMHLVGQKKVSLSAPLSMYIKEFAGTPVGNVRIQELLWHQSGLPAGYNFFRDLIDPSSYEGNLIRYSSFPGGVRLVGQAWGNPNFRWLDQYISSVPTAEHSRVFASGLYITPDFVSLMMKHIAEMNLKGRGSYRYSDLSFVLLQQVVERVSGMSLDVYLDKYITSAIGAKVFFNPLEHGVDKERIVPAQKDMFLRKQVLRGTVDDETAACLGGVSGNAGLFANASELGKLCQLILQRGQWQGKSIIPRQTVEKFITSRGVGGRRALGFDRPKAGANNPAADSASAQTIGHMGFTGTVFWIDPQNDLIFIFLSNRTYPTRQNNILSRERYRPRLHQLAYDALI